MKEGNPGMNKMANVLGSMMAQVSDKPQILDFGIIHGDYSLTTNHYPCPIPQDKYSVNRSLTYDPSVPLTETYTDGSHGHPDASPPGTHSHKVKLPKKMFWVKPGDRVVVAWIDNEAVVMCVVYNAVTLGKGEPNY